MRGPGLWDVFGSFAQKLWGIISGRPQPLREGQRYADLGGAVVDPMALRDEWRQALRHPAQEGQIADVAWSEAIPPSMYREGAKWLKRKYSVDVTATWTDLETGALMEDTRSISTSRRISPQEALEEWEKVWGPDVKDYEEIHYETLTVTGALYREGDSPWD